MLSERKESILKLIVEEYVKTIKPVGSKNLCEILNCSSATVRNEMQALEEEGLLEKTLLVEYRLSKIKHDELVFHNLLIHKKKFFCQ